MDISHSKKEKAVALVKAANSARLPLSSSTMREGCCNCNVALAKATKTSITLGEESSNNNKKKSGNCACLVKSTKTAKWPLVDEEESDCEDKIYDIDSFLHHQLNEKSSLRKMFTEATLLPQTSKREKTKDENKSKRSSSTRLPPRGGMIQKGISSRGRGASIVKGTRTAIIPFCDEPSLRINNTDKDSFRCSSFVDDENVQHGQQTFSWQETALRLPIPKEYNDDRSAANNSGKSQTYFSEVKCPSSVKVHSVEKFFAEEAKKERGVRPCCISAALKEQMLRSRKGGCSIVKESVAEKTQSSSKQLCHQNRSASLGKISSKGKSVDDVQAGTQRIYGLEVVGQIFQVLLDGKELWTAHTNENEK